jgi:hypothetical protein
MSNDKAGRSIPEDKIRGVSAISKFIGEDERRTYYLLDRRIIPAGKEGSSWIASKAALTAHYDKLTGRGQ